MVSVSVTIECWCFNMRLILTAHEGYNLKFFPLLGFES